MSASPAERGNPYLGPEIALLGPYDYDGVTMRVFPLRASPYALEKLCRCYLGIAPDIVRVRPALPYVFLLAINYGRMSPEAASVGWVAQNEVVFSVPVEWSHREDGRWETRWATVSPFIFVDEELSATTGREVYGWPKVLAWLDAEVNPWMTDPRRRRRLMTLKTMAYSELYAGQRRRPRTLLEVEQETSQALAQMPPDLQRLFSPLSAVPRSLVETLSTAGVLAGTFASALSAIGDVPLRSMLAAMWRSLCRRAPDLCVDMINLKQFRSSRPSSACYQALVNSPMQVRRYDAGGFLGTVELLRGDASAGFYVHIHQWPDFPIVESLGLEVEERFDSRGVSVATVRPMYPFWLSLDLRYGLGERLCWRTERSVWYTRSRRRRVGESPFTQPHRYVTTLGSGSQPIEGPFDFWDTTIRFLPLAADHRKLMRNFKFLRIPGVGSFRPSLPLVLLAVTSYGKMSSEANNVGWWADRDVTFLIPMRLRFDDGERACEGGVDEEKHYALFCAYVFSDSSVAVTTGREVTGQPVVMARLDPGLDPWIESGGLRASRRLLEMRTQAFPALNVGQTRTERLLLEIEEAAAAPAPRGAPERFDNLSELLDSGKTVDIYEISLKEFREAEDPNLACYQAIVPLQVTIGNKREVGTLDSGYRVKIHEYQGQPIVERLGLKVVRREICDDGTVVATLAAPSAPFWLKADIRTVLQTAICWRAGTSEWEGIEEARRYFNMRDDMPKRVKDLDDVMRSVAP